MTDHIEEMNAKLDQLKAARIILDVAKQDKNAIIEKMQASDEYQFAAQFAQKAELTADALEAEIKLMTLQMHELCAELPERVTVKMFTVVSIPDEMKAKEWAMHNFTPALKLDAKVFEKAAKDGAIPAELATVSKEPRAQIASKL